MKALKIHQPEDIRLEDEALPALAEGQVRLAIESVGICGSDLHYYYEGRCGNFVIREPFSPGHEASATVLEVKAEHCGLRPGDRVALNPGHPCGQCAPCRRGSSNLCEQMRFFGTASTWPHSQGLLRQFVDVWPSQCHRISDDISFEEAACGEPLAVAVHSAHRAGDLNGRRVLVLGAGPIGNLITAVCAHKGARVVVTDLQDHALSIAAAMGAAVTINVAKQAEALAREVTAGGEFDVVMEVTGSPKALDDALPYVRRGATLVQVGGFGAGVQLDSLGLIMSKELNYLGSFRFTETDYQEAVALLKGKALNLAPMLSATLPLEQAEAAFALARDRTRASKVHLKMRG
ncbi:L-idonate 5-dehydrogenase [Zobellella aerophila]|uniref:L-idonate 5-dehydrogenase n=1 Tax=Zobellella aerophila TaxID=870480 RepID=A0ABP6VZW7_9GAMM